ncbi:MAG: hypothetical protein SGPRY_004769 [Prymnesium sp.]
MQMLSFLNPLSDSADEDSKGRPRSALNELHDAALWNDTNKIKQLLRSGRAHVNEYEQAQRSLPSAAAAHGRLRHYRLETALMWAAGEGHVEASQVLIEHGAKISCKDANGRTALEVARRQGHTLLVEMLSEEERKQKVSRLSQPLQCGVLSSWSPLSLPFLIVGSRKAAISKACRAETQERAKIETVYKMNAAEKAVQGMVWSTAAVLLATGVHTWLSPLPYVLLPSPLHLPGSSLLFDCQYPAFFIWYAATKPFVCHPGYSPSEEDLTQMSMVQLNGVARIVLGVALLLPRWSALSLGLGLFAWLPNYQALQMPAVGMILGVICSMGILHTALAYRLESRQHLWAHLQLTIKLVCCAFLLVLGIIGAIFPAFTASAIYRVGVRLTVLSELQMACFSLLAPLGISVWLIAHQLDRTRHGATASAAHSQHVSSNCNDRSELESFIAAMFVSALLCFGSIVALVFMAMFALFVRVHKICLKEYQKLKSQLFEKKSASDELV